MSKKAFQNSTLSSLQKITSEPYSLKEKVFRLSNQMNQLKSSVQNEDNMIENLGKISSQQYNNLNNQIVNLRKAFNTLADVMIEELENVRTDFFGEINLQNMKNLKFEEDYSKRLLMLENLSQEQILIQRGNFIEQKEHQNQLQKQFCDSLKTLNNQFEQQQEDFRLFFDKLRIIVTNDNQRIDLIIKDKTTLQNNVQELKNNLEGVKIQTQFFDQRQQDYVLLEEQLQIQLQKIKKEIEQIDGKLQYNFESIQEDMKQIKLNSEGEVKIQEKQIKEFQDQIETKLKQQEIAKVEIEVNINSVISMFKESSKQIIEEFKKQLSENLCKSECKNKISNLEIQIKDQNQQSILLIDECKLQIKQLYYDMLKIVESKIQKNKLQQ